MKEDILETFNLIESLDNDYNRVQYLIDILKKRATGEETSDYEFKELRKYFKTKNYWNMMPKILIDNNTLDMFWGKIQPEFKAYKERRLFIDSEFFVIVEYLEESKTLIDISNLIDINNINIINMNEEYIKKTWDKIVLRIQNDPEGAITLSRTLLETILKGLAEKLNINVDKSNLIKMYKEVATQLKLSPNQHSEEVFKKILQGCSSSVEGLASLRNNYGDCHGKGKKFYKPAQRHARLAVNLAVSMSMFLIETYNDSIKK